MVACLVPEENVMSTRAASHDVGEESWILEMTSGYVTCRE